MKEKFLWNLKDVSVDPENFAELFCKVCICVCIYICELFRMVCMYACVHVHTCIYAYMTLKGPVEKVVKEKFLWNLKDVSV